MKKSLLTALLAALSISLVSCVNNPAPATTPNSTPTQTTPDKDSNSGKDDDKVTLKTITYSGDLKVGGQLSLVAKDSNGGLITPQTAVTYTATKGADLVTIQGNKVKLLKAGDVTIQGSYEGSTAEVSFTIVEGTPKTTIGSIQEAGNYTLAGKVAAEHTSGILISDGTGSILVYDRDAGKDVKIGDSVEISGDIAIPKKGSLQQLQFSYQTKYTLNKTDDNGITLPKAVSLTSEIADGWATTQPTLADSKLYTWKATAQKTTDYFTLNIEGSNTIIEPMYLDTETYNIEVGKEYEVSAYYLGYSSSNNYAGVMVTGLKNLSPALNTSETEIVLDKGSTQKITVTGVNGASTENLTWTSSNNDIATVSNDGTITGVADGIATITVSNGTQEATISVDVYDSAVLTPINKITIGKKLNFQGKVVAKDTQGYVVYNDNAAIYIYGRDLTSAVSLNDFVKVTGTVINRNGTLEISYSDNPTITKLDTPIDGFVDPIATELTADIVKGFSKTPATTNNKLYKWSATVGSIKSGNYTYKTLNVDGSDITLEAADYKTEIPAEGTRVNVEGFLIGYYNYASFVFTKIEEDKTPRLEITADKKSLNLADQEKATITVKKYNTDGAVTFTSSEADVATVEASADDPNKAVVTPLKVGKTTITAKVDDTTKAEIEISVVDNSNVTQVTLTANGLGLVDSYNDGSKEIDGVNFDWKQLYKGKGDTIQSRTKDKSISSLRNTTAFAGSIVSVVINWNAQSSNSTKGKGTFSFGSAALDAANDTAIEFGFTNETTTTINVANSDATYFYFTRTATGGFYFDSIVFNIAA